MPSATPERITYSMAARELLRNTLMDGACHELEDKRWTDITMADIARAAGVSRQTLYKEFGSRDEFAQALVMREADRFLSAIQEAIDANIATPTHAVSAAFDVFLTQAAENPLVRTIVRGEGSEGLLLLFTTQGQAVVEGAALRLTGMIVAGWPLIRRSDAELLSECLVRLAISYASLPAGSAGMTSDSVATLLGPYIDQMLAGGPRR